jgi:hypothetical protein
MSESAAAAAFSESTDPTLALIGAWGDQPANPEVEKSSTEEEVAFTPVRGGGRGEPASEMSLPYGMTLKELQKFHSDAKLYYGNRVSNYTEKVQKILINPATPEGKIVWVVNGPEYFEDEIVLGSSDADKFISARKLNGKSIPYHVGLQIFALLINGFDARPCADGEPFANLTHYLPKAKCIVDIIRERLDTLEATHRGAKYEIIEDSNPLVVRVQVLTPVQEPIITHHLGNGAVVTQRVKTIDRPTAAAAKTVASKPNSYAAKTGGGAGAPSAAPAPRMAPAVVPTKPDSHPAMTPAATAPAFNGALLSEILSDLSPYVGKSAMELERMHARGTLPGAVLRLLCE